MKNEVLEESIKKIHKITYKMHSKRRQFDNSANTSSHNGGHKPMLTTAPQPCKFNPCTNSNCPYFHSAPKENILNNSLSTIPCKFNPCTKQNCPYFHSAPKENILNDSLSTIPCKFKSCTKPNCSYFHSAPKENIQINQNNSEMELEKQNMKQAREIIELRNRLEMTEQLLQAKNELLIQAKDELSRMKNNKYNNPPKKYQSGKPTVAKPYHPQKNEIYNEPTVSIEDFKNGVGWETLNDDNGWEQ